MKTKPAPMCSRCSRVAQWDVWLFGVVHAFLCQGHVDELDGNMDGVSDEHGGMFKATRIPLTKVQQYWLEYEGGPSPAWALAGE